MKIYKSKSYLAVKLPKQLALARVVESLDVARLLPLEASRSIMHCLGFLTSAPGQHARAHRASLGLSLRLCFVL